MADKRLRLIVEAVTSQAQQHLRSFSNSISDLGAKGQRDFTNLAAKAENLRQRARSLGDEARSLGKDLEQEAESADKAGGSMARLGEDIQRAVLAYIGLKGARALIDMEQWAAQNLAVAESFEGVSQQYNLGSQDILDAIDRASKGTMDKYSAMAAASTAMRLSVATDIGEFEDLMKVAYMRARETGVGVEEAWGWITRGIGRASPFILDNLNFLVSSEDVLEDYARALGKTADELSKVEKQEALRNYVLEQGADDLERWAETGGDAKDVFAEWHAVNIELRQEMAEQLLPTVVSLTEALIDLQKASRGYQQDTEDVINAVLDEGGTVEEAVAKLEEYNRARLRGRSGLISWQEVLQGVTIEEKNLAEVEAVVADRWGQMYQESAKARIAMENAGDSSVDLAEDLEEVQDGLKKAADIWADYLSDVEQKNWQFGRRVADAQWSATQAAENAAFRLYEIERDAAQRVDDLLAEFYLKDRYDLIEHQRDMKRLRQDHLDEMRDLEWEYQQDVRQTLEAAPWWVRQALSKEFAERERIRKSGDEKALKQYDKQLLRRIKAVDPVYAKELKLLQEQYDHETDIKEREARKDESRREEDWRLQEQEQADALSLQLSQLERELADQRQAWQFSNAQRLESEKHAMDNLVIEHGHAMDLLAEQVQKKLADITPIWEHYGHEWAMALIQGMATGQMYTPVPAGYTPPWNNPWAGLQEGMPYVPRTMPAVLHRGEAVLTKEEAAAWRAGDNINITVNLSGGYTPYQAQRLGEAIRSELGADIRRRSR